MAIEETLLIKLVIDIQQSVKSINNLEKQFAGLKAAIQTTFGVASSDLNNLAKEEKTTAQATANLTEQVKKQKAAFDATKYPQGSYRQLNAQLKDLNNRFKELSATERNSPIGAGLAKNINKIKSQLKGIDANIGDFQRNVGNYSNSLKGLFQRLNRSLQSIGFVGKIRSIPQIFGAISGAVNSALKAVGAYNKAYNSTSVVNEAVKEASAGLVVEFGKEKIQLNNLKDAVTDETLSKKSRQQAVDALKEQFPAYFKNLTLENAKTGELESGYKKATIALIENSKAKVRAAILEELATKAILAQLDVVNAQRERDQIAASNAELAKSTDITTAIIQGASNGIQKAYLETTNFFTESTAATALAAATDVKAVNDATEQIFGAIIPVVDEISKGTALTEGELNNLTNTAVKTETAIERLNRRKGELESQIKNLIATNKDYSSQQTELGKITEKLTEIENKYVEATRFAEKSLAKLTRRQGELNDEIQNAIADGKPYDEQLNELIDTTGKLNAINKEFADVQAKIATALREFSEGSLSDYDARISALSENQNNLNITSQEYLDNQTQIAEIEAERDIILKALATDINAVAAAQADLNLELTDQEAQNAAYETAKKRIAGVTDATEAGAAQIAQIQKDLDTELKNIENSALQRKLAGINSQIALLETEKQKELALVANNESLKLAVEANFQQQKTELELQGANVRGQILKSEVDDATAAQDKILEKSKKTAEERKQVEQQVMDAIAQGSQMIFQLISNLQEQQKEKQLDLLATEEKAALQRAEAFGASEEAKTKLQEEFDAKREKIERDAATRAKGIALAQATIEVALAVLKALSSAPPPANAVLAGITAVLGAIQIAVIASQKFALGQVFDMDIRNGAHQSYGGGSHGGATNLLGSGSGYFAKGAYLKHGAYHSEGGMPIINPFSGQKVAEIEKGEAIINKHNTSLFYDELSFINSFKGKGVSFPNASKIADFEGLKNNLKQKGIAYGFGGTFGHLNSNMLKLQNGAIVAADIAREANSKFATTNVQAQLLSTVIAKLDTINRTLIVGFESIPSTASELQAAAQILQDAANAS